MPFFLRHRQPDIIEEMDKENCDQAKLNKTYHHFATINEFLSNWRNIYSKQLKPLMSEPNQSYSLLDIGFGGGDIPIAISKWANQDGIKLEITAIETDKRALDFVAKHSEGSEVSFVYSSSSQLVSKTMQYDFVISNNLLHHLTASETDQLLSDSISLSKKRVIFNDIRRSDIGYALYSAYSRIFFSDSFVTIDGLASIKRSYTKKELAEAVPSGWKVETQYPFRLLLIHDKEYEN
ncbi:MAG: methyltransferase domain-containing protein [Balneola sp.]|nr:MAG: methyltransferase domain-containing protein [Balneola sp.]